MEPMVPVDSVRDLTSARRNWAIKVKILRLWRETVSSGKLFVRMILCDREGHRIGATIVPSFVEFFDDALVESEWRFLSGFNLFRWVGQQRPGPHGLEIMFKSTTIVRFIEPISDDSFISSPSFQDVVDQIIDTSVLSDLLGCISSVGYLQNNESQTASESLRVLPFDLMDENGYIVNYVATGDIAREIHDQWNNDWEYGRVCLLRFWKFDKSVVGGQYTKLVFKSVPGCSTFVVDPPVTEAWDFRTRFNLLTDRGSVCDH